MCSFDDNSLILLFTGVFIQHLWQSFLGIKVIFAKLPPSLKSG
jgi:hypothetical protein